MPASRVPSDEGVVDFIYHEAQLLDEKRHDEWFDLFLDDGLYWMPLTRGQPQGHSHTSLFYEDKFLLKVRIERLKQPRSFSQHPPSFCQHVLQTPRVQQRDEAASRYVARTPFLYVESRLDRQDLYAGVAYHHLVVLGGELKIGLKKIELVNCDAALPSIQLFP